MILLQESCSDPVASYIVYAPTETGAINAISSGGDPNFVPLLPSGFAILPDGPSFGSEGSSGSLLTVSFQIIADKSPTADLTDQVLSIITDLVTCTSGKIKDALDGFGPNI